MDPSLWPLAGLRLHTDRVELRPPTDDDLPALADLYPEDVPFDPTRPAPAGSGRTAHPPGTDRRAPAGRRRSAGATPPGRYASAARPAATVTGPSTSCPSALPWRRA